MAEGQFYTLNIWEIRGGQRGNELEELTKNGIIPQYGQVPGVISVKLFKIEENDDSNKYVALTIYESREAYQKWWANSEQKLLAWQQKYKTILERWVDVASPIRKHGMTLLVDAVFPPGTPKIEL